MNQRRLIEEAFPLKKVSEDSKHEQYVSQGKPNSLHFWPARRPLAACRAAIIAALLPDPGDEKKREEYCRRIGNITRWTTESGPDLEYFRDEIRKAFGGRAPKVLDMFAGGGAIPLEAMRLGCDVTAIDYNPVAWFILKCTLEFPQKLAGKTWPLPVDGTQMNTDFTDSKENPCSSVQSVSNPKVVQSAMDFGAQQGDLAAHVRYWGNWVLERARQELAPYYPTIDGKPTVAYIWARTVPCQDRKCGATVPLLKTLWLCKKDKKRQALRLKPNPETHQVTFEIWEPGANDEVPRGTVIGTTVLCHCHPEPLPLPKSYIKACGHSGQLKSQLVAVVVDGPNGKEYRLPTIAESEAVQKAVDALPQVSAQIPYALPNEPLPISDTSGAGRAFTLPQYGFKTWSDLFTPRQLVALATLVKYIRAVRQEMLQLDYPEEWATAVTSYLNLVHNKLADFNCTCATWQYTDEAISNLFVGARLPITWDFVEANIIGESVSSFHSLQTLQMRSLNRLFSWPHLGDPIPTIRCGDATELSIEGGTDLVVTDPPYYDAIPYADASDFFFVWNKRIGSVSEDITIEAGLTPKSAELIQHTGRFGGNEEAAKQYYTEGMSEAFRRACVSLTPDGRMVIVFAHKDPVAWETLTKAIIAAGFTVTASWPLDTEKTNRVRGLNSAALATSLWLVCRKRPADAGIGRYVEVKRKMQERITERLRYFWDQGVSGPDFVWAAVGPALESYSSHKEVRRMDGSPFTVSEFLKEVRRLVADFALGRILHGASTEGLDEWTRYYLMHRSNFRLVAAPVGECILLAQGYGLDLNELKGPRGFVAKGKAKKAVDEDQDADSTLPSESEEATSGGGSGSDIRLLSFDERKRDDLGEPHPSGGLPLIDMLHRLMRLWQAGDTEKLTAYVQQHGLSQNDLFWAVAQAVLEMADPKTKERTLIEALVAWGRGRPGEVRATQSYLPMQ